MPRRKVAKNTWPGELTRWLARDLMPRFLDFVNLPTEEAMKLPAKLSTTHTELRRAMANIVDEKPPNVDLLVYIPLTFKIGNNWKAEARAVRKRFRPHANAGDLSFVWPGRGEDVKALQRELLATLVLFWDFELRRLLRKCKECRRYFKGKRESTPKTGRTFCSDKCRTQWHSKNRDATRHAQGERKRRRARKELRLAKK